jgi:hypothetical protein
LRALILPYEIDADIGKERGETCRESHAQVRKRRKCTSETWGVSHCLSQVKVICQLIEERDYLKAMNEVVDARYGENSKYSEDDGQSRYQS